VNRREFIAGTVATSAAFAMPLAAIHAAEAAPLTATMFSSVDEPWGAWVPGHVDSNRYKDAVRRMFDMDPDSKDWGEDWLWDYQYADDDDTRSLVILGEPEHRYMHKVREDDPELGDAYQTCRASDDGAIPITVIMY